MKKILALSGGGIRGVITAAILQHMEQSKGLLCRTYDLIAGTSTGGILACCAAIGIPMVVAKHLYQHDGYRIFSRGLRKLDYEGIVLPKYPASGIESVLREYLTDKKLSDCLCDILVTAWDHEANVSVMMTSKQFRNLKPTDVWPATNLELWKVGRRTSAAPTYFPSAEGRYHDGGTYANNPSLCALAELLAEGVPLDQIHITSVGTGATPPRPMQLGLEGALGVLPNLANVFIDAGTDAVDYICARLLGDRYVTIQTDLSGVSSAMDDASTEHIAALLVAAQHTISQLS